MAEAATKLPVKTEAASTPSRFPDWRPFDGLRNQVDRLFRDFETSFLQSPLSRDVENFWRRDFAFPVTPAVDIVEKDNAFEITAELPGLDAKNIELSVSDDVLTIKGEKKEEKEEKQKDYYLSERRYGSFERYFGLPDGVDADKIDASFKNGVLKVTLPKTVEAQQPAKKIDVKAA